MSEVMRLPTDACPAAARLRSLRPLLQLVLLSVLAFTGLAQDELSELDDLGREEPLNFAGVGQASVEGIEQVITGSIVVQGQLRVQDMALVRTMSMQALMRICENRSNPVVMEATQSIHSFGTNRPEFVMEFFLLPPVGGGQYCMETISEYGYGASEAPFDPVVGEPPFREALQMEFRNHPPTFTWSLTNWGIALGNHTCAYHNTLTPLDRVVTKWTTTKAPGTILAKAQLPCRDGDPLMPTWTPPDQQAQPEDVHTCTYATNACGCAAMRQSCIWVPNPGGGHWCQLGQDWQRVGCQDCPLQADCPLTPDEVCFHVLLPCVCADTSGSCRWDLNSQSCVVRDGGDASTTCEACSAQNFCSEPEAVSFDPTPNPRYFEVMGQEAGWLLNVSFDRHMELYPSAKFAPEMHCRSVLESRYTVFEVGHDAFRMSNHTNLQLDLSGINNDKTRECDLVLRDGMLRDNDYVFFAGLERGTMTVIVGDTVQPELLSFEPPNSLVGVMIDTNIAVFFTEAVVPHNGSTVNITALGGQWDGGRTGADVVVATIDLTGERATFNSKLHSLTLNLGGLLDKNVMYSFDLPPSYLQDNAGNRFDGLPMGIYQFRTTVGRLVSEAEPQKALAMGDVEKNWDSVSFWRENIHWLVVASLASGGLLIIVGLVVRAWWRFRQLRKQQRRQGGLPQPVNNFVPDALTGKELVGGKPVSEARVSMVSVARVSSVTRTVSRMSSSSRASASPCSRTASQVSPISPTGFSPMQAWGTPPTLKMAEGSDCTVAEGDVDNGTVVQSTPPLESQQLALRSPQSSHMHQLSSHRGGSRTASPSPLRAAAAAPGGGGSMSVRGVRSGTAVGAGGWAPDAGAPSPAGRRRGSSALW